MRNALRFVASAVLVLILAIPALADSPPVKFLSVQSPVSPGGEGSVTIQTRPNPETQLLPLREFAAAQGWYWPDGHGRSGTKAEREDTRTMSSSGPPDLSAAYVISTATRKSVKPAALASVSNPCRRSTAREVSSRGKPKNSCGVIMANAPRFISLSARTPRPTAHR